MILKFIDALVMVFSCAFLCAAPLAENASSGMPVYGVRTATRLPATYTHHFNALPHAHPLFILHRVYFCFYEVVAWFAE